MRRISLFVLLAAAAPAFAGQDAVLGTSVQANIVAMTVDLTPEYAGVKMEGTTGILAADAISRYRNGQVKPLLPLSGRSELGVAGAAAGAQAAGAGGAQQQQTGPR